MEKTIDWNPEQYLKFGDERTQPTIDLVGRINLGFDPHSIIDIGCGPGNSGRVLTMRWPKAQFLGIDRSPKMIEKANKDYPQHEWRIADASAFSSKTKYDIVFSNAAIQWMPDHEKLLVKLIELISDKGVLAIQTPAFRDMPVGKIIAEVACTPRWRIKTAHCSNVFTFHDYGFYYDVLSTRLQSIEMWETSYLHVLDAYESIIEWISSAGLKPYLDCLGDGEDKEDFANEIMMEIHKQYTIQKNGKVIFPFKRLFFIGHK
jgi:trans-aconitate 2-methyltransferase